MGDAKVPFLKAYKWALPEPLAEVVPLYYLLAPGFDVRADVAVAQAAKETNYGLFTGVVSRSFNNWCGLKTTSGGGNNDPNAHARFAHDAEGVRAHLEHLHLYAKGEVANPVDPRHFPSVAGTAPTVEALTRKWNGPNGSLDYGASIVRRLNLMSSS
jgi:N-acetylmuramoyl-L-alanine amidase